jgi:hypothetical protein
MHQRVCCAFVVVAVVMLLLLTAAQQCSATLSPEEVRVASENHDAYWRYLEEEEGSSHPLIMVQSASHTIGLVLRGVRVLLADYALLRRDFGGKCFAANASESEIDAWLVESVAVMRASQVSSGMEAGVNDEIPLREPREERDLFIPTGYGRAALVRPLGCERGAVPPLLDVKGSGARKPRFGMHGTGLLSLHVAVWEFLFEKVTSAVLGHAVRHSGWTGSTVGSYAVLHVPDFIMRRPGELPVGLLVRQTHERSDTWGIPSPMVQLNYERALRPYGLTATVDFLRVQQLTSGEPDTGPSGTLAVDFQRTSTGNVVDFSAIGLLAGSDVEQYGCDDTRPELQLASVSCLHMCHEDAGVPRRIAQNLPVSECAAFCAKQARDRSYDRMVHVALCNLQVSEQWSVATTLGWRLNGTAAHGRRTHRLSVELLYDEDEAPALHPWLLEHFDEPGFRAAAQDAFERLQHRLDQVYGNVDVDE